MKLISGINTVAARAFAEQSSPAIMSAIAVLALSLAYFVWLTAPTLTWMNTDADGVIYLHAATYRTLAHPTGAPAFNLLNMGILSFLPTWGDDFFKLALVSAIASSITALLLQRITRSVVPPLIFLASGVVVSQSTILETYALITLIMVAQYYWRDKIWVVVGLAIVGAGVHHLILLSTLPLLLWYWREGKDVRPFALVLLGGLWYLYLPLFNTEPRIFVVGDGIRDYIGYLTAQGRIVLGLAVFSRDTLTRVPDVLTVFFGGFLLASGPIVLWLWSRRKSWSAPGLLGWLFILPWLHYALAFPHIQYIWTMPAFAFGAIIAHDYLREWEWRPLYAAVGVTAAMFMVMNLFWYDIGRTLDNSAAASYWEQMGELPENAVIWNNNRGWEHMTTVLYNRQHGTHFTNLRNHQLIDGQYVDRQQLLEAAVKDMRNRPLYATRVTDAASYKVEIEPTTWEAIFPEVVAQIYWPAVSAESVREMVEDAR